MGTYHLFGHLAVTGKIGYGFEDEDLGDLEIEETLDGITYAVGCEYGVAHNIELVAELEGADIDSTRGMSFMFGAKFKF